MKTILIIIWLIGYIFVLIGHIWKKDEKNFRRRTIEYMVTLGLIALTILCGVI